MSSFGSIFLASVYSLMIKICGLIYKYVYRSKLYVVEESGSNFSKVPHAKTEDSVFLQSDLISNYRSKSYVVEEDSSNFSNSLLNAKTEEPVLLQSALISNSSKCQVMSGKNVRGFFEEPKTVKFVIQEMFVGSEFNDVVRDDRDIGCGVKQRNDLLEQEQLQEFDEELEPPSFYFNLLHGSCSVDEGAQEREGNDSFNEKEKVDFLDFRVEGKDHVEDEILDDHDFSYEHRSEVENIDQESDRSSGFCSFEVCEEREKPNLSDFRVEGKDDMEDEALDDQDFSYEVELIPTCHSSILSADQESKTLENDTLIGNQETKRNGSENWMRDFLDELDQETPEFLDEIIINSSGKDEDFDDEFIELENLSFKPTNNDNESTSISSMEVEELQAQKETTTFSQGTSYSDSESNDDDEDEDVLSEHQHLVQQMKMELKNCRIKGLPTISEECESPKMVDDLKPLEIDHKIEYKDVMEEIQMFYKSYSEKMRKLDILNYQTLHAISFLQLKDSEVFTVGKRKPDLISFVMPKILARKDQRVYADPMHKSINEMHRDLELVYVGHLCLSWEILCWLYVKARDLVGYNLEGNRSYNRSAEDFQQFQVLLQRFVEDEQFHGHRNQNYVKNRCMIRSLLQVPTIKDDCFKNKKERREETDAISLEMLVEIMRESMLIFRDFLFADKKSTNVVLKGVKGTKVDLQDLGNSELLSDIILDLQKKERRIRDQIRSQNCIVKKMKRQQELRLDVGVLKSQVELRLVSRVLSMSRLTTDQLVWCKNKVDNISFVGRKVQIEPCFLLFPC